MTDDNNILSIQTLRIMRQTIENSSQYSDDELNSCGKVLGSIFPMLNDVPGFLNPKEQQSFFVNLVSCFMVADMINNGFINPHASERYLASLQAQAKQMSSASSETSIDDEEHTIIIGGGKNSIN